MPRPKASGPNVSTLKKELRILRMKECPNISKMKKAEVLAELKRLRGDKFMEKTSLPEETIDKLKEVESETKKRNVGRKSAAKALAGLREVEAETMKRNAGRKSAAKALAGLREVEAETQARNEERKKAKPKRKLRKAPVDGESIAEPRKPKKVIQRELEAKKSKRLVKGSKEAKEYMAAIREKRSK
jgi:hypothetical protein